VVEWAKALELAFNYGVSAAALVATWWGIRCIVTWVGKEIVIPVRDNFLARMSQFFDRTEGTMTALTTDVKAMVSHQARQTELLEDIHSQGCGSPPGVRRPDTRIQPIV
jgi:hypothetical protein